MNLALDLKSYVTTGWLLIAETVAAATCGWIGADAHSASGQTARLTYSDRNKAPGTSAQNAPKIAPVAAGGRSVSAPNP